MAWANAYGHHRDQESVGSACTRNRVLDSGIPCEPLFELADLRPHDVLAVIQHTRNRGIDAPANTRLLRLEVDELDARLGNRRRFSLQWARGGLLLAPGTDARFRGRRVWGRVSAPRGLSSRCAAPERPP